MFLHQFLRDHHQAFVALCRQHKVKFIYAFGSGITELFDPEKSDIDLLVDLNIEDPVEYGEHLLALWDTLEVFFQRKVDLVTEESLQNPYLRKSIEASKKLIYDGQREEVLV
ncbi:MAG: nucleotidyltransferase family protein [Bacteroidota bacterium]